MYAAPAEPASTKWCASTCDDWVQIRYLGVGGFAIHYGGRTLLTGTSFTNPGFGSVALSTIPGVRGRVPVHADTAAILDGLKADSQGVDGIVVGHGHYDHALDVPFVADSVAKDARIFGNVSTIYTLLGDDSLRRHLERLVSIPLDSAATITTAKPAWYYTRDSNFRVLAIRSSHDPNLTIGFVKLTIGTGSVPDTLRDLPASAAEWLMGDTYAYLLDVLATDHKTILLRIYFQDASSRPPLGLPPASALWEHPVDVALLCVPTYTGAHGATETLLRWMRPGAVIASHWEWFFGKMQDPPVVLPITDLGKFRRTLERTLPRTSPWAVPFPHQLIEVGIPARR